MATIKAVSSKCGIGGAIAYVSREEKTEEKLLSGFNCVPETAAEEMQTTKELFGKTGGRTYKHFVQSFHQDEPITPEQAHDLARQFAAECPQFQGFEVLIATHKDRAHIHTHFIVNSVSFQDGHKFRMHRDELQQMKDLSDRICLENGLHICEKGKTFSGEVREETAAYTKEAYRVLKAAERGEVRSYVQEIALAVLECREKATSREDFAQQLQARGVSVQWTENRKHVTFSQGEKKVRNSRLSDLYNLDFSKEGLESEFEANLRKQQNREQRKRELAEPLPGAEPGTPEKSAAAFLGELEAAEQPGREELGASEAELASMLQECADFSVEQHSSAVASLTAEMSREIALVARKVTSQARGEHRERV